MNADRAIQRIGELASELTPAEAGTAVAEVFSQVRGGVSSDLVEAMWREMNETDRAELAAQLEALSSRDESS